MDINLINKLRTLFITNIYRRDANQLFQSLNKRQWYSPEQHRKIQHNKLIEILEHAHPIPYYRKYLNLSDINANPIKTLKSMPMLDKETLRDEAVQFLHPDVQPLGIGKTSGSTGISLPFYYDHMMLINGDVYSRIFKEWFGVKFGDKGLRLWGRPLTGIKSKTRSLISNWLRNTKTITPWDLSPDRLQREWQRILHIKPKYFYAYAMSITALAKEIERIGAKLEARRLGLKVIISTAETLYPSHKEKIADVFGCPVAEEYGAAEVSIMGHECPEGNLHIASDRLLLEFVDDEGNDVEYNQPGLILVTSFVNRAQPLIRYKIGDYGIPLADICPCGRGMPLMKLSGAKIIEMIRTPKGKIFSAQIIDYINLALMKNPNIGISEFRVTQKDINTFVVEIVPDNRFGEHSEYEFTKIFKAQLKEQNIVICFEKKSNIERLHGGKLLYFQSEIS